MASAGEFGKQDKDAGVLEKISQNNTVSESKETLYFRGKRSKLQNGIQCGCDSEKDTLQKDRRETHKIGDSDYVAVLG